MCLFNVFSAFIARGVINASAAILALGMLAFPGNGIAAAENNILLIVVDDLGFGDLSCQGADDLKTPSIDALFADSLKLNRFYANCPVCSPTRASVLTGCYPDRVGVPGVIRTTRTNSWGYFAPDQPTLPEVLRHAGYTTAAIGKWHLGLEPENHPNRRGFDFFHGFLGDMMEDYFTHQRRGQNYMRLNDQVIEPEGHATDLFSQWTVDFLNQNRRPPTTQTLGRTDPRKDSGDAPKPWFLYLAYNAPHTPIQPPQAFLAQVKSRHPKIDDQRAKLVALIEHLDHGIGQVVDALKSIGAYDRTTIVFTSDNGGQLSVGANNGPLRDGKQSMYEGGLRIPACIRIPGRTRPDTETDVVASTVDLMPTLLDVHGNLATATDAFDGRSMMKLVDEPEKTWPDREVYFVRREGGLRYNGLTSQALLRGDWKLVHNLPDAPFELFNLKDDPTESVDVARREPKILRALKQGLQRHVQRGGRKAWQKNPAENQAETARN